MITFPCAKINLGLNVINKRPDGYHNIETIFYPIPLNDALEIKLMDDRFPSKQNCDLKVTGKGIDCNEEDNIVVKAYNLQMIKQQTLGKGRNGFFQIQANLSV